MLDANRAMSPATATDQSQRDGAVGKQTLARSDTFVEVGRATALLTALQLIRSMPSQAVVDSQTEQLCAGVFASTEYARYVYFTLLNFMKVVRGTDRHALSNFTNNLNQATSFIGAAGYAELERYARSVSDEVLFGRGEVFTPTMHKRPPKGPPPVITPGTKPLPGTAGARPRSATDDRIDAARKLASNIRIVARMFDESNGFHIAPVTSEVFPDTITPETARVLVEKRLPELEAAIREARTSRNDTRLVRVMHTDPIPWFADKWHADGAALAAHLRAAHKRGVGQLERTGIVAEVVAGPIWGGAFGTVVDIVLYEANAKTGAEVITNGLMRLIAPKLARMAGGPRIAAAIKGALVNGMRSLIEQETRIHATDNAAERTTLEAKLLKRVICDALVGALRGGLPESEHREAVLIATELAAKLGIELPELLADEEQR